MKETRFSAANHKVAPMNRKESIRRTVGILSEDEWIEGGLAVLQDQS